MIKAVVEIPQGSYYKYEVDKQDGTLTLDRVLVQPYPYNYGFIPNTLCGDGDPLDVFIISDQAIHPLTKVHIELVGVLRCTDNGHEDDKLLALIVGDPFPEAGKSIIAKFLETYKTGFTVHSMGDEMEALEVLSISEMSYIKKTKLG